MPSPPNYLKRVHPSALLKEDPRTVRAATAFRPRYAELQCKSNFSFLRGASHPEELVEQAVKLGIDALALTDRHTLAGVVRMHCAAKAAGLKLLVGVEIDPVDAPPILLYAINRAGYGQLCRLITRGRLREKKGACMITLADVADHADGLVGVMLEGDLGTPVTPGQRVHDDDGRLVPAGEVRDIFGTRLYVGVTVSGGSDDRSRWHRRRELARRLGVDLVATNDVHYHAPQKRFLQDILTCIRNRCTINDAGFRLFANAERHLKSPAQMQRLFADCPSALARTMEIAERCTFSLDELRYEYPEAICPPGRGVHEYLVELTYRGAAKRYPGGLPEKIRGLIEHELQLIRKLQYEPYFLTVWDIVEFARSKNILCQGRGSAANSAVCYCLGITSVDPDRIDLLFERFVSAERNEPPDIDVDFEHERREEVFQYIYNKYGREHAGIVAEVITYRPRSAIRDVGKALDLPLESVDALAKKHDWWGTRALPETYIKEAGFDPGDRTMRMFVKLVDQLLGFPRHLSQHVGGFVITRGPLCEMVPLENGAMPGRTFIEWDKDDIDALGILKVDCLSLGMLTAIRKCLRMIEKGGLRPLAIKRRSRDTAMGDTANGDTVPPLTLSSIPPEDPAVYDMICRADTVGVFQIESRAQMSMLPRLKPRCFYDLVIEVAIVRPGPIQGGMVHPYLRRRNKEEPVVYPSKAIREVLHKTLGVPLFQEQAMRLAIVAAGFTAGEADQLRRAMAGWRRNSAIDGFREKLISGMTANGLSKDFAERCFKQICGFGEYGFPESHAASFALLVYVSCYLKLYYPAAFCASIINAQPMGFYHPAQLVRDAREHGVTVLPIDVNWSGYDCRLEGDEAWLRLGMRLIKGISPTNVAGIERARRDRPFASIADLAHRSGVSPALLARLAAANAMQSMNLNRREALWEVLALSHDPPLYEGQELVEPQADLPELSLDDNVYQDYATVGLSLEAHPISLVRHELKKLKVMQNRVLQHTANGKRVRISGLVLVRQRPATASGITFATIEDETANGNLVIRPRVYERYRLAARASVAVIAEGRVERQGEVVHVQIDKIFDMSDKLAGLRQRSRDFR
ncbi:MAG: error-prone DNA polymerase [Planctomycetota bacterium]|jgi:error-prone DNA polymerase